MDSLLSSVAQQCGHVMYVQVISHQVDLLNRRRDETEHIFIHVCTSVQCAVCRHVLNVHYVEWLC